MIRRGAKPKTIVAATARTPFESYTDFALSVAKWPAPGIDNPCTKIALGLCSEAGEFAAEVERTWGRGKAIEYQQRDAMMLELGDILYYVALAAHALGVSIEDVMSRNVAKLKERNK